jgi:hypothetical protein
MIKPIVEGHGEVDAVPVLLRKIAGECFDIWDPPILRPGRYPAGRLIRKDGDQWVPGPDCEKAGGHARNEGATAILALLDLDDDCAKEVSNFVAPVISNATGIHPSGLVFASREYEAWFLASAETMAENTPAFPEDPESVRDAKGHLERHLRLEYPYVERTDQPAYSSRIDPHIAFARSRSFRKLVKEFRHLLIACGRNPSNWPIDPPHS